MAMKPLGRTDVDRWFALRRIKARHEAERLAGEILRIKQQYATAIGADKMVWANRYMVARKDLAGANYLLLQNMYQ